MKNFRTNFHNDIINRLHHPSKLFLPGCCCGSRKKNTQTRWDLWSEGYALNVNEDLRNRQTSFGKCRHEKKCLWIHSRSCDLVKRIKVSPWISLFCPDRIVKAFQAADGVLFLCVIRGSRCLFLPNVSVSSLWPEVSLLSAAQQSDCDHQTLSLFLSLWSGH